MQRRAGAFRVVECAGRSGLVRADRRRSHGGRPGGAPSSAFLLALDLAYGLGQAVGYVPPELGIRDGHSLVVEVLAQLLKNVLIALHGQIRLAQRPDVVVDACPGDAQLARGPLAQEPVAALLGLELELFVEGELPLEGLLAVVEGRHANSPGMGAVFSRCSGARRAA